MSTIERTIVLRFLNFRIIYFPPQKISVIKLILICVFVENETINELNVKLLISPYTSNS